MKEIELKIPNLGEAEDTEIIEISVKKGERLSKNDPIIVLESEKAAMEVPSDYDGKIKDIKALEKTCNLAKSIGFAGKACIHPGQVDISNKIF